MRRRLLLPLTMAWACVSMSGVGCKQPPKIEAKKMAKHEVRVEPAGEAGEGDAAKTKPSAKPKPTPKPAPAGVYSEVRSARGSCRRSLCIGGSAGLWDHPHFDLNEVCRRSRGSVQRCEGDLCTSVWPAAEWRAALDALVISLDHDGDGEVRGAEAECPVSLGGWSTGAGLVATQLAAALVERVPDIELDNLLAVAPYLSKDAKALSVDPHFERAFVYRSTRVGKGDCSHAFEDGPWTSPAPRCAEHTTCYDYDYAMQGEVLAYLGRRGNRTGWEIDHCSMPAFVAKLGLENLDRGLESYSNLVPPYAGTTTRGGRDPHARGEGEGEGEGKNEGEAAPG